MKRILFIVAMAAISLQVSAHEVRNFWNDYLGYGSNGVQDEFNGESGPDIGGPTWNWDPALVPVPVPTNVVTSTSVLYGVTCTLERGELCGGLYWLAWPQSGVDADGYAIHGLHGTGVSDMYHAWEASYTAGGTCEMIEEEALARGWVIGACDGKAGGHALNLFLQHEYEFAKYIESKFGIKKNIAAGTSYGAMVSTYLNFLFPEYFKAFFARAPTAFDMYADIFFSKLMAYQEWGMRSFFFSWWYDSVDEAPVVNGLSGTWFGGGSYESLSMARRFALGGGRGIVVTGEDDIRININLWRQYLEGLGEGRIIIVEPPRQDHEPGSDPEWRCNDYLTITGRDPLDDLVALAEMPWRPGRLGATRHQISRPLFNDYFDDIPQTSEDGKPGIFTEAWRIGFGSSAGLFDSAIVDDIDGDSKIDVVFGSIGGSLARLEQPTAGVRSFSLSKRDFGGLNMGLGIWGLAYDEDAGIIYAGGTIGRVWVFDAASGEKLCGPSVDFGSELQCFKITDDLNDNGINELWIRSWNRAEGGGGYLHCLEYRPNRKSITVLSSVKLASFISDYLIVDYDWDGTLEALVATADGGFGAFPFTSLNPPVISTTAERWSYISELNQVVSPAQYDWARLAIDDNFIYGLTGRTFYTDFSNLAARSHLSPHEELRDRVFWVFDRVNFDQRLQVKDYTALDSDEFNPCMTIHVGTDGSTWMIYDKNTKGPKIRLIGEDGSISDAVTADVTGWPAAAAISSIRVEELNISAGNPEIIAVLEGGQAVVLSFGWNPNTFDDAGQQPAIVSATKNPSRCYSFAVDGSGDFWGIRAKGYDVKIDRATGEVLSFSSSYNGNDTRAITESGSVVKYTVPAARGDFGHGSEETVVAYTDGSDGKIYDSDLDWSSTWAYGGSSYPYRHTGIHCGDFDGDGDDDVLIGTVGGRIRCYNKDGASGLNEAPQWELDDDLGWQPIGIDSMDVEGGAAEEVVVGVMMDNDERGRLYWLAWDADEGKMVIDQTRTAVLPAMVYGVKMITLGGKTVVLAGTGNGYLYAFDGNLRKIWRSKKIGSMMGVWNSFYTESDTDPEYVIVGNTDYTLRFDINAAAVEEVIEEPLPDTTPPTVTVTAPNGGETYDSGDTETITWTASDDTGVTAHLIEFSDDSGVTWDEVQGWNESPSSSYSWPVIVTPSSACRIKISARDAAGNVGSDMSDADFTVTDTTPPTVTVVTPNGGESIEGGEPYAVTWTADDDVGIAGFKILLSSNGGSSWSTVYNWHAGDPDIYLWEVPATLGSNYRIGVSVQDAAANITSDTSDASFEIVDTAAPVVTVTAPNGGERWGTGATQSVTWTVSDAFGADEYRMDYRLTELGSWVEIFDWTAYAASPYDWTLPTDEVSTTARVRVQIRDASLNEGTDNSNAVFGIVDTIYPTITVAIPNGGESWEEKTTHSITWTADDNIGIYQYRIEYSTAATPSWMPLTIGWVAGDPDTHSWNVPVGSASATCLVKISVRDEEENETADQSDAVFEITP